MEASTSIGTTLIVSMLVCDRQPAMCAFVTFLIFPLA
jgi:hypothetical protein